MTSLSEAVRQNDLAVATLMLRTGVSANSRDPEGYTPLMIAAGSGSPQMVELLLAAKADVYMLEPRMGASALHKAAQSGSVDVARLLLDHGAFIDLQSATLGHTPLIDAVWHKNATLVRFLLDRGAKTSLRTHYGRTAMDWAKQDSLAEIIQMIEERDSADAKAIEQQTLMAAVLEGNAESVRRLVAERAAVDERAPMTGSFFDGYTPLGVAALLGHADIVRELLDAGADPRRVDGLMKATPGHKGGYMGHHAVLQALLQHREAHGARGLELDAQGPYNGFTALHDAVWHGHFEAVRVLVAAGARLDLRGHNGMTARELAEVYGYDDIAGLLREAEGSNLPATDRQI